ncbi:acyltransferase [Shewanella waksmanii]|uniref:acyltransferase n=1 Tax=Shewanella waksmanii TaxID=213783 RepID=UPI003736FEB0
MPRSLTLAHYVKRRNGVALGASGSLSNMLNNALGAGSFALFWHYWNPIWGYYLGRYVMQPTNRFLPHSAAVIITFAVSGALHDLAISLVKFNLVWPLTPWFSLMGVWVVLSNYLNIQYHRLAWSYRCSINLSVIIGSYGCTQLL